MESILKSIKKMLGVPEEYLQFDADIIMHINTVLVTLNQMGVGPTEGFEIEDDIDTWTDFLGEVKKTLLNNVRSYVYLKVRLLFDPPDRTSLIEVINRQIDELEWRITAMAESLNTEEE